jgi:prophage regulatory protein
MKERPGNAETAARPAPIRPLPLPEVMSRTGLGQDTVYRLGLEGKFPKPVKIAERASGWVESERDAYLAARISARDNATNGASPV